MERSEKGRMTRRKFLWLGSLSAAGIFTGCATNPVTGESQLMLISESQEIQIDRQYAPHQLSSDYGVLQDAGLNRYIETVGKRLTGHVHRKNMPYNFHGVNATYVNAYAFPGGTIAATRGILLSLQNEAELASLLGHELGHVNMRHTAEQMSKGQVTQLLVGGAVMVIGVKYKEYAGLAQQLGMLGSGMLLAKYSRDNEREADALGNQYMVESGYSTDGFVGLMKMLKDMSGHGGSSVQVLFSTHPMSDERYDTAVKHANGKYAATKNKPLFRERYMDNTAKLRSIRGAIGELQKGESFMGKKKFSEAETHFRSALKQAPNDYAGLLLLSKALLAQNKNDEAGKIAEKAKAVNPGEAQAHHLTGVSNLRTRNFSQALAEFSQVEQLLPGNPGVVFFKGYCYEAMKNKNAAAREYSTYLKAVRSGDQAKHAYQRLVEWGYIKPKQ